MKPPQKGPGLADIVGSGTKWNAAGVARIRPATRWFLATLTALLVAAAVADLTIAERLLARPDRPGLYVVAVSWDWMKTLATVSQRLTAIHLALAALSVIVAIITSGFRWAGPRLLLAVEITSVLIIISLLAPLAAVVTTIGNLAVWLAWYLLWAAVVIGVVIAALTPSDS